jgi:hypothetical protein
MIAILSSQKEAIDNAHISSEEIYAGTYPYPHEINITDGCEFLDDAIRMKDQPLRILINENE